MAHSSHFHGFTLFGQTDDACRMANIRSFRCTPKTIQLLQQFAVASGSDVNKLLRSDAALRQYSNSASSKKKRTHGVANGLDSAVVSTSIHGDRVVDMEYTPAYSHTNMASGLYQYPDQIALWAQLVNAMAIDVSGRWDLSKAHNHHLTPPLSLSEFAHAQAFPLYFDLDFILYGPYLPIHQAVLGVIVAELQKIVHSCWINDNAGVGGSNDSSNQEEHPNGAMSPTMAMLLDPAFDAVDLHASLGSSASGSGSNHRHGSTSRAGNDGNLGRIQQLYASELMSHYLDVDMVVTQTLARPKDYAQFSAAAKASALRAQQQQQLMARQRAGMGNHSSFRHSSSFTYLDYPSSPHQTSYGNNLFEPDELTSLFERSSPAVLQQPGVGGGSSVVATPLSLATVIPAGLGDMFDMSHDDAISCFAQHLSQSGAVVHASHRLPSAATTTAISLHDHTHLDLTQASASSTSNDSHTTVAFNGSAASIRQSTGFGFTTTSTTAPEQQQPPTASLSDKRCISAAFNELAPELRIPQKLGMRCYFPYRVVNVHAALQIREEVVSKLATTIGMHTTLHDLSTLCIKTKTPYDATVGSQTQFEYIRNTWSNIVDEDVYLGAAGPHSRQVWSERVIECPYCNRDNNHHSGNYSASSKGSSWPNGRCHSCEEQDRLDSHLASSSSCYGDGDGDGGSRTIRSRRGGGGGNNNNASRRRSGRVYEGYYSTCEPVYVLDKHGTCHSKFRPMLAVASSADIVHASVLGSFPGLPQEMKRSPVMYDATVYAQIASLMCDEVSIPTPLPRRPAQLRASSEQLIKFIHIIMTLTRIRLPIAATSVDPSCWTAWHYKPESFKFRSLVTQLGGSSNQHLASSFSLASVAPPAASTAANRKKTIMLSPAVISQIERLIRSSQPQWRHIRLEPPVAERRGTVAVQPNGNSGAGGGSPKSARPPLMDRKKTLHVDAQRQRCLNYQGPCWIIYAKGDGSNHCSIINKQHSQSSVSFRIYPAEFGGIVQCCSSRSTRHAEKFSLTPPIRGIGGRIRPVQLLDTLPCYECAGVVIPIPEVLSSRLFVSPPNTSGGGGGASSSDAASRGLKYKLRTQFDTISTVASSTSSHAMTSSSSASSSSSSQTTGAPTSTSQSHGRVYSAASIFVMGPTTVVSTAARPATVVSASSPSVSALNLNRNSSSTQMLPRQNHQ